MKHNYKTLSHTQHDTNTEESLGIENTVWAGTVVASGRLLGVVVYTGTETRAVMNNSSPRSKIGLLDIEVNNLTKVRPLYFIIVVIIELLYKFSCDICKI